MSTYVLCLHVYTSYYLSRFPIPEDDKGASASTEQGATVQPVDNPGAKTLHSWGRTFLEIPEEMYLQFAFENSVCIGVPCPRERISRAEGLVSPRKSGIDDILPITDNRHKTTVRRVVK